MTAGTENRKEPHFKGVRFFFGLAIGLGAALLFWQQLMLGRMLLPVFGGVPAVWLTSLAFFQSVLLTGYALAHLARRLRGRAVLVLVAALALAAALQMALAPGIAEPSALSPLPVMGALAGLAGFSLLLLSMLSPVLQGLYARLPQPDAHDPYFLYAASNFGSFAGLLAFPLLIEPFGGLMMSQKLWWAGFGVFLCLLAAVGYEGAKVRRFEGAREKRETQPRAHEPSHLQTFQWLFLSFLPSALSFGATAHLVNDIAPVPLFSMVPLALYLLTFVIAFARKASWAKIIIDAQPVLAALYIYRLIATDFRPGAVADLVLVLAVFFATALSCHGALAARRPEAGKLTYFYLIVALGGALGALVNLLVIPFILPLPLEFAIFVAVALVMHLPRDVANLRQGKWRKLAVLLFFAAVLGLLVVAGKYFDPTIVDGILPFVLLIVMGCLSITPGILALFSVVAVVTGLGALPPLLAVQRDFFGVKRVVQRELADGQDYRLLVHGTTTHGMQRRTPAPPSTEALLYYGKEGGLDDVIAARRPARIAAVGLGTGNAACMAGDGVHFFEIDPGIVDLAARYFTYLKECPPRGMAIGDARLTLARDTGVYDLLLIDAFSSDAIPVHLLTKEAFEIYKSRLAPDGLLLLHLSNRYLDLYPVALGAAEGLGWKFARKRSRPDPGNPGLTPSDYALLSPDSAFVDKMIKKIPGWRGPAGMTPVFWTDDKLSLVPVMKIFRENSHAEKN